MGDNPLLLRFPFLLAVGRRTGALIAIGATLAAGVVAGSVYHPPFDPAPPVTTTPTTTTPTEGTLIVTNQTYVCSSEVNYNLVKVTISQQATRMDGVRLASGCTGTIGRIEVDTWNADGLHVGAGAHDVTIQSGYIHSFGVCSTCGAVHVDGMQVLGGQRVTFENLDVNYPTATNSALYINQGAGGLDRPTDVVCDGCTFRRSPTRNRVVRIGDSLRSGIRNSTVYYCGSGPTCDAPTADAIWYNGLATDPIPPGNGDWGSNTIVLIGG